MTPNILVIRKPVWLGLYKAVRKQDLSCLDSQIRDLKGDATNLELVNSAEPLKSFHEDPPYEFQNPLCNLPFNISTYITSSILTLNMSKDKPDFQSKPAVSSMVLCQ